MPGHSMTQTGGDGKRVRNPTISISKATKTRLDRLKVVPEETYDTVLRTLLDQLKGPPTEGPA